MAYGELRQGAGIGMKDIICLTLGTGVGGGIILDGQIFHGSRYVGAELGHTTIFGDGRLCGCGNYGCLEAYVGRDQIVERTRAKIIKSASGSPILEAQMDSLTLKLSPKQQTRRPSRNRDFHGNCSIYWHCLDFLRTHFEPTNGNYWRRSLFCW